MSRSRIRNDRPWWRPPGPVVPENAFEAGTGVDREALFGDPQAQEFYWAGHNPLKLVDNLRNTRLYVSAGDGVPNPGEPDEVNNTFGQLAEAELGQQAAEFASAAQDAGADVTYAPHQGIHAWAYWRADLSNAIKWGLFDPPTRPGRQWTYSTVANKSAAWGLKFRFATPPAEVVTFTRDGRVLRADGAGEVKLITRAGCKLRGAQLPFELILARGRHCAWPGGVMRPLG